VRYFSIKQELLIALTYLPFPTSNGQMTNHCDLTPLLNTFILFAEKEIQYKTEKDTTDTYKDKRNIQIQKYFKQP